jgi:hypothetical protein
MRRGVDVSVGGWGVAASVDPPVWVFDAERVAEGVVTDERDPQADAKILNSTPRKMSFFIGWIVLLY